MIFVGSDVKLNTCITFYDVKFKTHVKSEHPIFKNQINRANCVYYKT